MESRKIKVSIVEDKEGVRRNLVKKMSRTEDIDCISEYGNAEDALRGLVRDRPDIVIMDIGLPYMNGTECMLRVKIKCPDISFLMFTIFHQDEEVFRALKAGADGYVLKKEGAAGVVNAIRERYDGGAPMSQEIAMKVLTSFHNYGPGNPVLETLTPRQFQILQFLSEGLLYKEIAEKLTPSITVPGLKQNINRIYKKLQVNNRTEAMLKYFKMMEWGCDYEKCPMQRK